MGGTTEMGAEDPRPGAGAADTVLEVARLTVRPGAQAAFERDFAKAARLLPHLQGYLAHELRGSLEQDERYALLIDWQRRDGRQPPGLLRSPAGARLGELLQAHLAVPPELEQFRAVPERPAGPLD
jgi:hypothetical protein